MIDRKTVSQCVSSDYCKGYNAAVEDIEEYKRKCLREIAIRERELNRFVQECGATSYMASKAYNILVGIKIAYRIMFGEDHSETITMTGARSFLNLWGE